MASSTRIAQATRKFSLKRDYLVGAAGLVFTLALCALAIVYWDYIQIADRYGYFGVFIISILTGVTVLIPIPGLLVVFTLGRQDYKRHGSCIFRLLRTWFHTTLNRNRSITCKKKKAGW